VYEIRESRECNGLGLFATKDISMGDLILVERALTITPSNTVFGLPKEVVLTFRSNGLNNEQFDNIIRVNQDRQFAVLIEQMHPDLRARFKALCNVLPFPNLGICITNGFNPELVDWAQAKKHDGLGGKLVAVGDVISRINHNCRPNSAYAFHVPSLAFEVRALRDIFAGEEITSSYVDMLQPTAARQRDLFQYNFVCKCPACTDEEATDRIRGTLQNSQYPRLDGSVSLRSAKQTVLLLERAGLQKTKHYSMYLFCMALAYRAAGKMDKRIVYEGKAQLAALVLEGRDRDAHMSALACPNNLRT